MGVIIYNSEKVVLNNWRVMTRHKTSVIVVNHFYHIFQIMNINLTRLKEIANSKEKVNLPFYFLGSTLSCESCFGQGYVTWVERATKRPSQMYAYKDCIDFTMSGKVVRYKYDNKVLHISRRKGIIIRGMEYCSDCQGSAVRFKSLSNIIEAKA